MQLLIKSILRYKLLFLAIVLVCTLFAIILLPQLRLNSEYINLLPPKPEHLEISEDVLSMTAQDSKDVYCLFEGNAIFSMQALNALQGVLAELEAIEGLRPPLSALSFITFQKKGTRLASIALNPNKNNEPFTEESAALFAQRLRTDRIARGLLSTEDGDSLLIQLSFQPDMEYSNEIFDAIAHTLDRLRAYGSISLVGTPLFEERVQQYLTYDLERLLSLCLLVIVLMFFLAFRSKRAVIIPFSLSVIALLWTLAVMVLLDYELTVVNIIVPSMVLILGSSYAIHILSEYFQTIKADNTMEEKEERIILAVGRISKTIFGASLTTIVGFLSLVLCELQAFRELGLAVSIGISFCALLSLIYIPSLLAILPNPKQQQLHRFTHGRISKALHRCSIAFVRAWPIALVLMALLLIGFVAVRDDVRLDTDYLTYFPKDDPLIQRSVAFARKIGGSDPHYITLTAPDDEQDYFFKPEVLKQVFAFESHLLATNEDITHLFSFPRYTAALNEIYQGTYGIPDTPGLILMLSRLLKVASSQFETPMLSSLIRDDGARITITVRSYDSRYQSWESLESVRNLQASIQEGVHLLPEGITIDDWGIGVDALRMGNTIKADQDRSLIISLILVFLLVAVQFRSPLMGLLALIPTMTGIMCNYVLMFLFDIPFDVVTVIFASITIGVGVDAAIHFLIRFKLRQKDHPNMEYAVLLSQTLEETGRPILLSSISLIAGLMMLLFASFIPVKYFGLLLSFALLVTTAATLFILPALMMALEKIRSRVQS